MVDYGRQGGTGGYDAAEDLRRHMEETRTNDIVKTVVIVIILAVVAGYFVGLERESFLGVRYTTGEWRPVWGLIGAAIPVIGGRPLYKWFRERRSRRFYFG